MCVSVWHWKERHIYAIPLHAPCHQSMSWKKRWRVTIVFFKAAPRESCFSLDNLGTRVSLLLCASNRLMYFSRIMHKSNPLHFQAFLLVSMIRPLLFRVLFVIFDETGSPRPSHSVVACWTVQMTLLSHRSSSKESCRQYATATLAASSRCELYTAKNCRLH